MKEKKVIVAHPFQQHSYKLACALEEKEYLCAYYTTVYDRDKSITRIVKKIAKGNIAKRIGRKHCEQIDDKVKTFCEISGIVYLAMIRFPRLEKVRRAFGTVLTKRFGVKVAKAAIKNNADAVVMYDTTADSCFSYLKKHAPHIKRILDMSSNSAKHRLSIYESEAEKDYIAYLREENPIIWNQKATESNTREILNADYYLVASEFVKKSLEYVGANTNKAFVARYGIDQNLFSPTIRDKIELPIKIVYTGSITYSKGIHHLLNVISKYDSGTIQICLCGRITETNYFVNKYKSAKNISFRGFVTHDELSEIYHSSDLFVILSLADGFSFAALEAMSTGLPVIASDNTGIEDIIRENEAGYVVETGNEKAFNDVIDRILNNNEQLLNYSKNSISICEKLSWTQYSCVVQDSFRSIFNE